MAQTAPNQNPFQQLISECDNDPTRLQARYETHRSARNAQFKTTILSPDFPGWTVDEILSKLHAQETGKNGKAEEPFIDHRNNLAFYARPPKHIRELVDGIQRELRSVAPSIWFTPSENLHMTTLELTNSRTRSELEVLVSELEATGTIPELVDYTFNHRSRLIKPVVSYDASAMALSFVPAAGEGTGSTDDGAYSYHHLRRDLYDRVAETGIKVIPRYIVPSAHVTIARFITHDGFLLEQDGPDGSRIDREQLKALMNKIEHINQELQKKYWPSEEGNMSSRGEWVVGHEKGLELCKGASWYGKGESVLDGKGFN